MTITAVIVMLAVVWFMTLLIMLPIGLKTQGDMNSTVEGTPESAPANINMRRKFLMVTLISVPIWLILCAIIELEIITVADFDWRGVLSR